MYIVYEVGGNSECSVYDSYEEAVRERRAIQGLYEEYEGHEEIYIAKVIEKSSVVEDTEIEEDPKAHGFDRWVKWKNRKI